MHCLKDWEPGVIDQEATTDIVGTVHLQKSTIHIDSEDASRDVPVASASRPKEKTIDLGNGVTMDLVLIPAGSFYMGSPTSEKNRRDNEGPLRKVQITKSFYMGMYEVTQGQYIAVMEASPSHFNDRKLPAYDILWDEAVAFCDKVGRGARLPTEAEWEYACRAGTQTRFSHGDDLDGSQLGEYAWYRANSQRPGQSKPTPRDIHYPGQKKPNQFGLYDMHGNVGEWCADWYEYGYRNAESINPTGPSEGKVRVVRGGIWYATLPNCRSASRDWVPPSSRVYVGFRIVLDAD